VVARFPEEDAKERRVGVDFRQMSQWWQVGTALRVGMWKGIGLIDFKLNR
jgi:hypothetical protein